MPFETFRRLLRTPAFAAAVAATACITPAPFFSNKAVAADLRAAQANTLAGEILDRPLFNRSRRNVEEEQQPETAKTPPPEPALPGRLEGITIVTGAGEALFERGGERPLAVKEGQKIGGWTVRSIDADQVVLRSAGSEQIVKLAAFNTSRAAPLRAASRKSPTRSRGASQVAANATRAAMTASAKPAIPVQPAPPPPVQ